MIFLKIFISYICFYFGIILHFIIEKIIIILYFIFVNFYNSFNPYFFYCFNFSKKIKFSRYYSSNNINKNNINVESLENNNKVTNIEKKKISILQRIKNFFKNENEISVNKNNIQKKHKLTNKQIDAHIDKWLDG